MSGAAFEHWLATALREIPLRTNSLIVTLFGDAIAPHGGAVLLGSLIDLVEPLGINSRAVRTSVFRLMQEDWLLATPVGRRSEYSLTESGSRKLAHAYRRIYDTPHDTWDGQWQIVVVPDGVLTAEKREALRRDLLWDGYGALSTGIFAHPSTDDSQLRDTLVQTGCLGKVVPFKAASLDGATTTPMRTMVQQCWNLSRLADDYQRFIARFQPVSAWLDEKEISLPPHHFLLRTLLIHEFRRVQLRDPQLPEALLAEDWPGHTARALCRELYEKTIALSEKHLYETLRTQAGNLPPADKNLLLRFGGIGNGLRPDGEGKGETATAGAPARNRTRT